MDLLLAWSAWSPHGPSVGVVLFYRQGPSGMDRFLRSSVLARAFFGLVLCWPLLGLYLIATTMDASGSWERHWLACDQVTAPTSLRPWIGIGQLGLGEQELASVRSWTERNWRSHPGGAGLTEHEQELDWPLCRQGTEQT